MPLNELKISVVVPLFNETSVFTQLCQRLSQTLRTLGEDYEVIFVDDGSRDETLHWVRQASAQDPRLKYLGLSRNFGHQTAITAGIDHAQGDVVVVMDGDLQDPPELIPQFIAKWREGWDVVYGVREKRKESFLLKACYAFFYWFLHRVAEITIPPDAGDFCLMDSRVVETLKETRERNRYVRGIRAWAGFDQIGLPYERDRRFAGASKYSLAKLMKLAVDGLTSFSNFPLRLCGYLGYLISFLSLIGLSAALIWKIIAREVLPGWTSIIITISFLGGIQLVMLSVVGSYVGRIYTEVQQRPLYVVREAGNFNSERLGRLRKRTLRTSVPNPN